MAMQQRAWVSVSLVAGVSVLGIWTATWAQPVSPSAQAHVASEPAEKTAPARTARLAPKVDVPTPVAPPATKLEQPSHASEAMHLPTSALEQAALAEEDAYWSHPRFQRIAHLRGAPATAPTGEAEHVARFAPWESRFLGDYFAQLEAGMAGPGGDVDLSEAAGALLTRLVGKYAETELTEIRCTPAFCRFEARFPDSGASRRAAFIRHLKAAAMQGSNKATVHLPEGNDLLVGYVSQTDARLPPPTRSFMEFMDGS
jgi:hypothetical protein